MSLTSFVQIPEVREGFRNEFNKPELPPAPPMAAPPVGNQPQLVGTAFDYLLRFRIRRANPKLTSEYPWVAEQAVELCKDRKLKRQVKTAIEEAKYHYRYLLATGNVTDNILESCLKLAMCDSIARGAAPNFNIGDVRKESLRDLRQVSDAVNIRLFTAKTRCLLNPTFGAGSELVGGADADLIIDDCLIEIKTYKNFKLDHFDFNQLVGYYCLACFYNEDAERFLGPTQKLQIDRLGIYFSRHAFMWSVGITEIIDPQTFPAFLKWFRKSAKRHFGTSSIISALTR